jgi:DNA repair protein RadC
MESNTSVRIHDLPLNQRPREKLTQYGPGSLDNAELLSLFISTGIKGRSSIDIGHDLLRRYGGLGALGSMPASALAMQAGLGLAKAAAMAAAFELGARVAREQIHTVPLDTPEQIHRFFGPQMQHLPQEQLIVAGLDARLRHINTTVVSVGTVSETSAHPREVLRPVITRAAYGFVMLHNHPSGDPTPSAADNSVTRRIAEAATLFQIQFVDHVIIGRGEAGRSPYFSYREAGMIG